MISKETLIEKKWVTAKTNAVYDPQFSEALGALPWAKWFESDQPLRCRLDYLSFYPHWIQSSKLNKVSGLEHFPVHHLINGTTQTFDEMYFKYASKRLRLFRGEYAYHRRAFKNHLFLEDGPLAGGDFVVVSAPFCSTGGIHPQMHALFEDALRLQVPVIVDCAYFGTCTDIHIELNHPAIESVSFSLTKGLGLGDIRSGVRFSRSEDDLPISQQNRYDHSILAAAKIGLYMMNKFSPDFIPQKYRALQLEACAQSGIHPTPCMHLALGDESWNEFRVDGAYNRLGIRELIRAKRKGVI